MKIIHGDNIVIVNGGYFTNTFHFKKSILKRVADFKGCENFFAVFPFSFRGTGESVRTNASEDLRAFKASDKKGILAFIEKCKKEAIEKVEESKKKKKENINIEIDRRKKRLKDLEADNYSCIYKEGYEKFCVFLEDWEGK